MALEDRRSYTFVERYAWVVIFGLGLLLSASAAFITLGGANPPMQFQADTGVLWGDLTRDYPTVARQISLLELLIGVGYFGFAFLTSVLSITRLKAGDFWAWMALWAFPILLGVAAALFFTHGQAYVGYYYLGFAALSAVAMLLPARRYLSNAR